jgi:alkylation response protein AidB-like acyl-CoA dehydrogenase
MAAEYAKVREQFGVPIGTFQGLKHQIADMAIRMEPCRGLYWYAAHAFDAVPDKVSHAAAQAKAHVCDAFLQCARDTVEAHGGIGFTWEHDAHIYLKRAMFDWAWLGQPSRHRERAATLAGW